jgi:hypothetical protein
MFSMAYGGLHVYLMSAHNFFKTYFSLYGSSQSNTNMHIGSSVECTAKVNLNDILWALYMHKVARIEYQQNMS